MALVFRRQPLNHAAAGSQRQWQHGGMEAFVQSVAHVHPGAPAEPTAGARGDGIAADVVEDFVVWRPYSANVLAKVGHCAVWKRKRLLMLAAPFEDMAMLSSPVLWTLIWPSGSTGGAHDGVGFAG